MKLLQKIGLGSALAVASVGAFAADPAFDTSELTTTIAAVGIAFAAIGAAYVGIPIIKWGWKKIASFF